jgi:methyl coenzyme M reductase subunit C-like uncharacterized protein (methanogenesis marker protein 7)
MEASAIAEAQKERAEGFHQELLEKLDVVAGVMFDGPLLNNEEVNLLAHLPREDLEQIVDFAEEYAGYVLEYAHLARQAIKAQGEAAADAE